MSQRKNRNAKQPPIKARTCVPASEGPLTIRFYDGRKIIAREIVGTGIGLIVSDDDSNVLAFAPTLSIITLAGKDAVAYQVEIASITDNQGNPLRIEYPLTNPARAAEDAALIRYMLENRDNFEAWPDLDIL